jgi:hypothetical protein
MIAVRFISFWTEAIRLHPAFSSAAAREQGVLPFFLWTFLDQGDRVAVLSLAFFWTKATVLPFFL